MKTKSPLLVLFCLAVAGIASAATVEKAASQVEVSFSSPEKFADVKRAGFDSPADRDDILAQLKTHLIAQAASYLAAGQRLEVKVTDVDLAGDFEPWRGPNFQDIRVVKDVYPPRVSLEFRLLDADGKVISEGKRQLSDMSYLATVKLPSSDPLRYDKQLLSDWVRREFKRSA